MFVRDAAKAPIFFRESILQGGIEDPHISRSGLTFGDCPQIQTKPKPRQELSQVRFL